MLNVHRDVGSMVRYENEAFI